MPDESMSRTRKTADFVAAILTEPEAEPFRFAVVNLGLLILAMWLVHTFLWQQLLDLANFVRSFR